MINQIDALAEKLTEEVGIEFRRDEWETEAPENYGAIEYRETRGFWAGGVLIDEIQVVDIFLYIDNDEDNTVDSWRDAVESVLAEDDYMTYRLTDRVQMTETNKIRWTWRAEICGPLEEEEE